jgi:uncharacterized protein YlxW (UPF0749 family)
LEPEGVGLLLRRFITSFRERKWTDFAIELVIVIGGVFIGIQAANWNEYRIERETGRLYVERLIADLRKDLASRQALVSYYESVIESAEQTVRRLNAQAIENPARFVIDAYRATEYNRISPTRATLPR